MLNKFPGKREARARLILKGGALDLSARWSAKRVTRAHEARARACFEARIVALYFGELFDFKRF